MRISLSFSTRLDLMARHQKYGAIDQPPCSIILAGTSNAGLRSLVNRHLAALTEYLHDLPLRFRCVNTGAEST